MARLSAAGAPATPERTSEEEEVDAQPLNNREGATSTRKYDLVRNMASSSHSTTTHPRAMGRAESRETLQQRNQAIREASRQATQAGKLPKVSGRSPYSSNGPRRLRTNPLANAKTYDVPSDDEDTAPRRTRQPVAEKTFSPLKRNIRPPSQSAEQKKLARERELLDQQFVFEGNGGAQDEDDSSSQRAPQGSPVVAQEDRSDAAQEDRSDAVSVENDAHHMDYFPDRLVHETEEAHNSEDVIPGADSPARIDLDAYANNLDQHDESVSEHEQPTSGSKRKRRRSRMPILRNQGQASSQPKLSDPGRKKRGRPSNLTAELHGAPEASTALPAPQIAKRGRGRPPKGTSVEPSSARSTAKRHRDGTRRSTRLAGEPSVVDRIDNTTTHQPERRPKQSSVRSHTAENGHVPSSDVRSRANSDNETTSHNRSDAAQPHVEHAVVNNLDPEEQPQNLDDDEAEEEEDSGGDEADVEDDEEEEEEDVDDDDPLYDNDAESLGEADEQPEPSTHNRHRLFGHWNKIRTMSQEVAKYRGSTIRIKDDAFKQAIAVCKELRRSVRTITADTSADRLVQTITECQGIIGQARELCGSGTSPVDYRNKKRGFHVFKHLVPALARLFKAVVLAFERVDIEAAGMQQISLDHLAAILDLSHAITECEGSAYHGYQSLVKPIKRDVHTNIVIPLRDLHSALEKEHRKLFAAEKRRQVNEELARDFAEMEEERVRRAQRRHLETRNQEKWKQMNNLRLYISRNTSVLWKMNHLRSCPLSLVETADGGRPFLPDYLRPRAGVWSRDERRALMSSLSRHADTHEPLESLVFENVMKEQCHFRLPLADKNLLEIVIKSNEILGDKAERCAANGIAVDAWVEKIPNWMEVVRYGRAGASPEDPNEFE